MMTPYHLIVALCLSACRPPGPAPVPPRVDGGLGDCEAACRSLERMNCPGAQGSPGPDDLPGTADDITCTTACIGVEAAGITSLATACIATAPTCALADACMEQPTP